MVESTALEMRHTGNRIGGSNPPLSAIIPGVGLTLRNRSSHRDHARTFFSLELVPASSRANARKASTPAESCDGRDSRGKAPGKVASGPPARGQAVLPPYRRGHSPPAALRR